MSTKYIIGSKHKETGEFSISRNPKIWEVDGYTTQYSDVVAEAKRLAKKQIDKTFIIMKVRAAFEASDVIQVEV